MEKGESLREAGLGFGVYGLGFRVYGYVVYRVCRV